MEALDNVFKWLIVEKIKEFTVEAWKLWQRRNAYVIDANMLHPSTLVIQSKKTMDEFEPLPHKSSLPVVNTTTPIHNWIAPPKDTKSKWGSYR